MAMTTLGWIFLAFFAGSLPFSVWLGRFALRKDIRSYGDHNPGATNVLRAGGAIWGGLALILDMLKGGIPVGLAWYWGGVSGWLLVIVAIAPILGHAYSPFLRFQGGKAIAVSVGVWGGLTVGEAPIVQVSLLLIWYSVVIVEGWAVILTVFSFLAYLLITEKSTVLLSLWLLNTALLAWKHRHDLAIPPGLRSWLKKVLPL